MKYKALLLGFLLLMPLVLIAMPLATASHGLPGLYVAPKYTKFYGPCIKDTPFTIDVKLWNSIYTEEDIYAFDFKIKWDLVGYIKLVSATYHSPWTNFFEVANETILSGTGYHLALTATPPSGGLTDVDQSVLTLVFTVEKDLCWPDWVNGKFDLYAAKFSSDGTKPVPIEDFELDDGFYEQYSVQPNIELSTTDASFNATDNSITAKCVSHTFDIEVDLTNVTNVYGFGVLVNYNPDYLETDVQKVSPKPLFNGPYEKTLVYVGPAVVGTFTVAEGQVLVMFVRPSEKAGICGAVVPVVDILFHTIWTANTTDTQLPTPATTTISICGAFVMVKCDLEHNTPGWGWPGPGEYDNDASPIWGGMFGYYPSWLLNDAGLYYTALPSTIYTFSAYADLGLIVGDPLLYKFKPSKYDLNLDCVVDGQDLKVLLPWYTKHTTPLGNSYGDLYDDGAGLVDIYDFVAIAKKFGPVDP